MKKLVILILTLAVIASGISASAEISDLEGTEYETAAKCLEALGIMGDDGYGNFAPNINITRAEACGVIANIMNLSTAEYQGMFSDVQSDMKYAGAIEAVCAAGIVNGNGDGLFYPDDYISYHEAVKIFVTLLGRNGFAEALGGYPYGYLTIAKRIDITKDVNETSFMRGEFAKLAYYSLKTEVAEFYSASADSVTVKDSGGRKLISLYRGIDVIEGVVTQNEYTSLEKPDGDEGHVRIDGTRLSLGNTDIKNYIGYSVEVFFNEEKEEIVYYKLLDKNRVITVTADDAIGYADGIFSYYNSKGNAVRRSVYGGAHIIYNNRAVTSFASELFDISDDGKILFIDYDADGRDDVIVIDDYDTYVVSDYDSDNETLYLKNAPNIDFSQKRYEFMDENGTRITGDYIKEWSIVSVMISQDGEYAFVYSAGENKINGKVTAVSADGKIGIDGTVYDTTEKFAQEYNAKLGEEYLFLRSITGKVAAVKEGGDDKKIGYIVSYKFGGSFDDDFMLRILKEGKGKEKFLAASVTDKVSVDGDRLTQKQLYDRLSQLESDGKHLIVRYAQNDENKIYWIDTLYLGSTESKENALMEAYTANVGIKWYKPHFMTAAVLNEDAPVLYIPTGLPDSNGVIPEENQKIDENYGYRGLSALVDERVYSDFVTYKVGINTIESCAVIFNISDKGGTAGGVYDTYMAVTIVEEISKGLDEEGLIVNYLTGYTNHSKVEAAEAEENVLDGVESGDVVKLSFDSDKKINGYKKLFDASEMKVEGQIDGEMYNTADAYNAQRSIIGNLYQYKDGKLLVTKYKPEELEGLAVEKLRLEAKPITEENVRNAIVGLCEIREIGNRGFYTYDKEKDDFRVSDATGFDLKDFVNYGNDYVKIYMYSIYSSERAAVIYK